MPHTLTISLNNLRFYGFHGVYEEERKTGNEFEVNLAVSFSPSEQIISELDKTINYGILHELARTEMQDAKELLETFVMSLAEKIHLRFPEIKKVDISVTKLNPPIPRFTGNVAVRLIKEY